MKADIALGIIGACLAVSSIIIVYIMFALQSWSDRVARLVDEAIGLSMSTSADSFERKEAAARVAELGNKFPWIQVVILGLANIVVSGVGMLAGLDAKKSLALHYSMVPLAVLLLAFAAAVSAVHFKGRSDLDDARDYLGQR